MSRAFANAEEVTVSCGLTLLAVPRTIATHPYRTQPQTCGLVNTFSTESVANQVIPAVAGYNISVRARALLCAALLAANRVLTAKEIAPLLGVNDSDEPAIQGAVEDLQQTLKAQSLGIVVEAVAGGYRLVVDAALIPDLSELLSPPPLPPLSNAAVETLALVAYQQPVTRGEVEAARGASCASTLETLQERELIKVVGRKDVVGKPLLYATTERFLLEFGLGSLDDLPPLSDQPAEFLRG